MARSAVGPLLVCASLVVLGCGESPSGSTGDGNAGRGGSSGAAATGGSAGTTTGIEPYFQPGTRLKPLVIPAGPGLDIIEHPIDGGFYDSELDFDCLFALDKAGVERCFPAAIIGNRPLYADASCTRPVLTTGVSGSAVCDGLRYQYVVATPFAGEDCGASGYHVGGELARTTPLFYAQGSSCTALSENSSPVRVYQLEAVPPETFVGMHRGRRPRAPGLDAYVREGDDGSWQVIAFFDPARDAPCFDVGIDTSPPSKCIPPWVTSAHFADAACEVRIADVRTYPCPFEAPTTLLDYRLDPNACPPVRPLDLYEIDGSHEAFPHSLDTSGACVATDSEAHESYFQGARIDLATLPNLETLVVGSGAVKGRFSGFDGIPFLPDARRGPLVDAASGVRCDPFTISDGSLRCVPQSFEPVGRDDFFYESSSCSEARVLPWRPDPPCLTDAPLPQGVVLFGAQTECTLEPILTEAIAIAGPSSASTLYFIDPTTRFCEPVDSLSPGVMPLRLGEPLDPAEIFAPIERTIRQ